MTKIEKMEQYIKKTASSKDYKYCLVLGEIDELGRRVRDTNGLFEVISLAFDYGKAKGYRYAMANVRKGTRFLPFILPFTRWPTLCNNSQKAGKHKETSQSTNRHLQHFHL